MHKNMTDPFGGLASHFERSNYYLGKMMTVRDFKAEQSYLNEKRWLLNRLGLGWGVLCGLKVISCGGSKIAIEPGLAIDRWGYEIYLKDRLVVDLETEKIDEDSEWEMQSPPDQDCLYIYLKYVECPAEPAPVAMEECGMVKAECAYGRIREEFRVVVSHKQPMISRKFKSEQTDILLCEIDCVRFLENHCRVMVEACPPREKCLGVPLARVCYDGVDISEDDIDNCNYRQLAFSNERLYELLECLRGEVWKLRAAAFDRRQYVPLLTQTIKGLSGHNGKFLTRDNFGKHPIRMTSDGDFIWVTDRNDGNIRRVNIAVENHIDFSEIYIGYRSWGIAYDGRRMWVTCQSGGKGEPGKVIGINVCDLSDRVEINGLKPEPREIVYDDRYLWVSHGEWESNGDYKIHFLSKIDPIALNLVGSYPLRFPECEIDSEFKAMLFDGERIWVVFYASNGNGLREIDISGDAPDIGKETRASESKEPEDLAFDGQHLWLSGDEGLAEINPLLKTKAARRALGASDLTAMAFDGRYIWIAEPPQSRVNLINVLMPERIAGMLDIRDADGKRRNGWEVTDMCFDGHYIWIAAFEGNRGIIHRLLA